MATTMSEYILIPFAKPHMTYQTLPEALAAGKHHSLQPFLIYRLVGTYDAIEAMRNAELIAYGEDMLAMVIFGEAGEAPTRTVGKLVAVVGWKIYILPPEAKRFAFTFEMEELAS